MTKKLIGVISDTHGLLREEALHALNRCDLIIHAGDVGSPDVITELRKIAPVSAVRGNTDIEGWAEEYPLFNVIETGNKFIYVIHEIGNINVDPKASGFHVVISGHSHRPSEEVKDGVLYFNPGSAGPRRFNLPVTAGQIQIDGDSIKAKIIKLL